MVKDLGVLTAADYVHLHNHTQYSLLDGLTKVRPLIERVKELGMSAVSITDHGTMSGAIEFYKAAKSDDIKPLIGMETYVASRGHTDRDAQKDKQYFHLILIAMNNQGYKNLMQLSTIANLEGFYYKPRVDHELLEKYNEGLIVLSGCIGGEIGDAMRQEQYDKAKETALWYKKVFGDRYYIEVQDHGHPEHPSKWDEQVVVNERLFKLAKDIDVKTVVTCDAHYLKHEDQEAHEILLCVQTGAFLTDEKRMSLKEFELHVTRPDEIIERWGKVHPDTIRNTRDIADRCDVSIELGKILIPKFPVPKGETEKSLLDKYVYQGLAWRYGGVEFEKTENLTIEKAKKTLSPEVLQRTEYELGIIDSMGFNGYFLIIADFFKWGKGEGIVFGPGRGSAAGSIIAYSLRITELDPLHYDLLFERFLNPDRISMPDIDIDIQDTRRDEVIQYCVRKYGKERVANIVTFGTMAARNAVRDVARVLQVPYSESDRLAKMIPPPVQGRHILLETSLKNDQDLKNEYETNPTAARVFDLAVKLEGTIRSHGVHAAGVVIAPDDIVNFAPLEMAQKGVVSTQYSMNPIEELGLLKMDFLGLSNLTIIKNALRIIKKVYGDDIDINHIPLDDAHAFDLLQRGDTTGVFQLESAGMRRYLKELKPTVFEDIVAMVALYRPGPMQFIDDFISRKHGLKAITYENPKMEAALKNTYGVLVYQEQVMQISKDMCGFTGGQADTLRKGIAKKIPEVLAKMKVQFIEGAIEKSGADKSTMEAFWKKLEDFAAYCFNKSHAACYGLIAYQTAYLKAHYPSAFMAALMTSDYDDNDRLAIEISECQHMGIDVLPPDINESYTEFAVVPDGENRKSAIRFGMSAIKNVGVGAVEEIVAIRSENGEYKSLEDFVTRVSGKVMNKKIFESLTKVGALDAYGERQVLLSNLDLISGFASKVLKESVTGQVNIFGDETHESVKPQLVLEMTMAGSNSREQLQWERELLGIYLSKHPLDDFGTILDEQVHPMSSIKVHHDGKSVTIGGVVMEFKEIVTKKGQKMAFVKLADKASEIELILFPSSYQQTLGLWEKDKIIIAKGKVSGRDKDGNDQQEMKILVDEAREVTHEQAMAYQSIGRKLKLSDKPTKKVPVKKPSDDKDVKKRLYIRLVDSSDTSLMINIKKVLDLYKGDTETVLVMGEATNKKIIKLPLLTDANQTCVSALKELVGEESIIVQ